MSGPVVFGPGGHRNNLGRRHMPADLYTLHLKYFDRKTLEKVAATKKKMVLDAAKLGSEYDETHGWNKVLDNYENIVATWTLEGEDIELPEYRAAMQKQVEKYSNQFVWGRARGKHLYRIPERFSEVF